MALRSGWPHRSCHIWLHSWLELAHATLATICVASVACPLRHRHTRTDTQKIIHILEGTHPLILMGMQCQGLPRSRCHVFTIMQSTEAWECSLGLGNIVDIAHFQ
jgi:hypothetical protein